MVENFRNAGSHSETVSLKDMYPGGKSVHCQSDSCNICRKIVSNESHSHQMHLLLGAKHAMCNTFGETQNRYSSTLLYPVSLVGVMINKYQSFKTEIVGQTNYTIAQEILSQHIIQKI